MVVQQGFQEINRRGQGTNGRPLNCREAGEERIKNLPLRVEEKKRILRVP
jgi:hypothetical protein